MKEGSSTEFKLQKMTPTFSQGKTFALESDNFHNKPIMVTNLHSKSVLYSVQIVNLPFNPLPYCTLNGQNSMEFLDVRSEIGLKHQNSRRQNLILLNFKQWLSKVYNTMYCKVKD